MPKIRTHYDNLQIARTASDAVVRAAYRGLSQQHHPDKNPKDRETAERIMKVINEAYAVLSDPVRRRQHDEWIDSQESEQDQNDNSPSVKTQQSTESSEELIVTSKRWVAIGYFLFAVAMLVYGLSAWFSPIGGEGWTGRGPMGILMEYVQIFGSMCKSLNVLSERHLAFGLPFIWGQLCCLAH
jgi:curved DNA-binding protein CbpA